MGHFEQMTYRPKKRDSSSRRHFVQEHLGYGDGLIVHRFIFKLMMDVVKKVFVHTYVYYVSKLGFLRCVPTLQAIERN
jgi:hypothetical protein